MRRKKYISSRRLLKAKADELMLAGENHLNIILALIAITASAMGPVLICSMLHGRLEAMTYVIALLGMEFFLVLPMIYALIGMARDMTRGESVAFSRVFASFGSLKEYIKALMMSFVSLILPAILIVGVAMSVFFYDVLSEGKILVGVIVGILGLLLTLISLFFGFRFAATPAFVSDGNGLWHSLRRSFVLTRGKTLQMLRLTAELIPLVLISAIAVCIPLYLYTLPRILCMYSVGVDDLIKNNE